MKFRTTGTIIKISKYLIDREHSGNKRRVFKTCILVFASVLLCTSFSFGQCDKDAFLDKCASGLGTYNYIKSFVVDANPRKKSNSEYSYIFSKGSTYIMISCTENVSGGKMILNLYDRNHILVASTWDDKTKKLYPDLQYPCSATGVYYIKTVFVGTKSGCGICILGFSNDK